MNAAVVSSWALVALMLALPFVALAACREWRRSVSPRPPAAAPHRVGRDGPSHVQVRGAAHDLSTGVNCRRAADHVPPRDVVAPDLVAGPVGGEDGGHLHGGAA